MKMTAQEHDLIVEALELYADQATLPREEAAAQAVIAKLKRETWNAAVDYTLSLKD